ncbi:hypothetical protein [Brooklawnia sp.]|uniref:hypothetical protein n=1 Tax=Brooklawnia sp. TaxID=2699740 RepID=UPI00311EAFD3
MADLTSASTGAGGLGTSAARWALTATWGLGLASDILSGAVAPPFRSELLALPFGLVAAVALTRRGDNPLPTTSAIAVGTAAVISATGALASGAPLGHTWSFNFAAYLAALLLPRGNIRTGVISSTLIGLLGLSWAVWFGASPSQLIDLLGLPLLAPIVGGIWRWLLVRMVAQELNYHREIRRAAMATTIATDSAAATQAELVEIGGEVGWLLRAIRDGAELDADLAADLRATEADLRDRIRSPNLRDPILRSAINRARRRGVDVRLLGRSTPGTELTQALVHRLADTLDAIAAGTVTLRAIPLGRERLGREGTVSVLSSDEQASHRLVFDADGGLISRG